MSRFLPSQEHSGSRPDLLASQGEFSSTTSTRRAATLACSWKTTTLPAAILLRVRGAQYLTLDPATLSQLLPEHRRRISQTGAGCSSGYARIQPSGSKTSPTPPLPGGCTIRSDSPAPP